MIELKKLLADQNIQALVVTNLVNVRYLSGFSGSAAILVVAAEGCTIITDFRYREQMQRELQITAETIIADSGMDAALLQILQRFETIAFEGNYLTAGKFAQYRQQMPDKQLTLLDIDQLRLIKTPQEIQKLRRAAFIANQAFTQMLAETKPAMSELDFAATLEFYARRLGAAKMSFDTIVASGANSALPHAKPTYKVFESGDLVTVDFGVVYQGYCSDMTRTFAIGRLNDRQKEIYHVVQRAQSEALAAVKSGMPAKAIDNIARSIITEAGYGEYFGHATGHGVGLDIHENPRIAAASEVILRPGMVITIEPGIYIPGVGGVRIEDLVVVTEDGSDVLTAEITKELLEIY